MIHEVRFKPNGGGTWYANSLREFVAKHVKESKEKERVLWYFNGSPINETPQITFIGSKNWVGIRAYNDEDAIAVYTVASQLAHCLDAAFDGPPHQVNLLRFAEKPSGNSKVMPYYINRLVLSTKLSSKLPKSLLSSIQNGDLTVDEATQEMVTNLINRHAKAFLGDDCPFIMLNKDTPMKWGTPIGIKGGLRFSLTGIHLLIKNDAFAPIQVGSLRTHGYGDIRNNNLGKYHA